MVAITDKDLEITVEAETVAKAQRMLGKARKAKAEERAVENAKGEIAYDHAYAAIGRICATAWDGLNHNGDLPCGWRSYPIGSRHTPITERTEDMGSSRTYTVQANTGTAESAGWYSLRITHVLTDGSGCAKARSPWMAIGENEGKLAFVSMPTILTAVLDSTIRPEETA
jgi:hypothetical protein